MEGVFFTEGLRMLKRSIKIRAEGIKRYSGNAQQICKQIINDCWNGKYFQVSNGNFNEFYTRDFGWCTEALLNLGYRDKVLKTLEYAMDKFVKQNKIATAINPEGKAFDFPCFGPDNLPYFLNSLRLANAKKLIEQNKEFIERKTKEYFNIAIDKDTGLVKKKHFSSMKDHSIRQSSCYDNCMVYLLSKNLDELKLENPFKQYNYQKLIKENFWTGNYFLDDLSGKKYISSDSNIFPFICEVFNDKEMLKKCIQTIQKEQLDKPFPLKYSKSKKVKLAIYDCLAKGYEETSNWTHMGPMYIKLIKQIDKEKYKFHLEQYKKLIEEYGNYLEVFDPKGKPFKSLLYYADEGMLWSCNILEMLEAKA